MSSTAFNHPLPPKVIQVPERERGIGSIIGFGAIMALVWCLVILFIVGAASDRLATADRWFAGIFAALLGLKALFWSVIFILAATQQNLIARWRPRLKVWPATVHPGEVIYCEVGFHPSKQRRLSALAVELTRTDNGESGSEQTSCEVVELGARTLYGPGETVFRADLHVPADATTSGDNVRWQVTMSSSAIGLNADIQVV